MQRRKVKMERGRWGFWQHGKQPMTMREGQPSNKKMRERESEGSIVWNIYTGEVRFSILNEVLHDLIYHAKKNNIHLLYISIQVYFLTYVCWQCDKEEQTMSP